jgi:purine-binding chemotaxis protein CheW
MSALSSFRASRSSDMKPPAAAQPRQYLSFFLGQEEYALGILQVREIIEYDTVTRIPNAPVFVRGVLNLRGSVVPVVDLAVKFGLPPAPVTKWSCIVVVEVKVAEESVVVGLVADSVSQVVDFLPEDIEPPPAFGTAVRTDFLQGMGRSGKKFVLLLDVDRVLSTQEVHAAQDVLAQAEQPQAEQQPQADAALPQAGAPEQSVP